MPNETVSFKEQYERLTKWQDRATLIGLYHTAKCMQIPGWRVLDTAAYFEVSIGLVSEDIRLGKELDSNPKLAKVETREKAVGMIERKLRGM